MRPVEVDLSQRCRAVITGIGMVTPLGPDATSTWKAAADGLSFASSPSAKRSGSSCVFDLHGRVLPAAPAVCSFDNETDEPAVAMTLAAAREAVADAGLDVETLGRLRAASTVSCSKGGLVSFYRIHRDWLEGRGVPADFWRRVLPSSPGDAVAREFALNGGSFSMSSACVTGLHSLIAAVHAVSSGRADVVLAGATDASLTPPLVAGFDRLGALSTTSCRPFDRERDGFVIGEGAAVMVVESPARARRRFDRAYAQVCGWGWGSDACHLTRPREDGATIAELIGRTLHMAGRRAEDVGYVNAHATGTRLSDPIESRALRAALGPRAGTVPVSSLKGALGHLLGAAGAVELALTALALRDGIAPPTANLRDVDPACALNHVLGRGVRRDLRLALKIGLGFGGHVGIILLERAGRAARRNDE